MSAANAPIRLLLVEDVPQVAQYVRGLLNAQTQVKLVDVVNDGGRAAAQARQLRPDVIIVDWLLQGRTKGDKVVAQLRESGLGIPVVVLTVPQNPVARDPAAGIDGVLGMPFSGFELVNVVVSLHQASLAANDNARSTMVVVYAPKGGVGKTTSPSTSRWPSARPGPGPPSLTAASSSATCARSCGCRRMPPRSSTCRPTGSARATSRTSCGATRPGSTSCWPRRGSRWRRWSASATWRRPCRSSGGSTGPWSWTCRRPWATSRWPSSMPPTSSSRS